MCRPSLWMSLSCMSPSWTRIHIQTRFHRVYIVIKYMAYTKPSCSRTSVVLLGKLGYLAYPDLSQVLAPDLVATPGPHHVWHVPLGVTHVWGESYSYLE